MFVKGEALRYCTKLSTYNEINKISKHVDSEFTCLTIYHNEINPLPNKMKNLSLWIDFDDVYRVNTKNIFISEFQQNEFIIAAAIEHA